MLVYQHFPKAESKRYVSVCVCLRVAVMKEAHSSVPLKTHDPISKQCVELK